MKAIILAGGRGTRLEPLTRDRPKGLLEFQGEPLIGWQIEALRAAGIDDIAIATGYRSEMITFPGVQTFENPVWSETNMVETLLCARSFLSGDLLVAYADLLYTPARVRSTVEGPGDVRVAVDRDWRAGWIARHGTTETDLESLEIEDGRVVDLGRPLDSSVGLDHRYVGLTYFSADGVERLLDRYDRLRVAGKSWARSGKAFAKGYMTDLLGALIDEETPVTAAVADAGWWEFDTIRDHDVAVALGQTGEFQRFVDLESVPSPTPTYADLRRVLNSEFSPLDPERSVSRVLEERWEARREGASGEPTADLGVVLASLARAESNKDVVDVVAVLATGLLTHDASGSFPPGHGRLLDRLQKALALHRRVFSIYRASDLRRLGSDWRRAEVYALLSLSLQARHRDAPSLVDVNTALKLNDVLLAAGLARSAAAEDLVDHALRGERELLAYE